MGSAPSCRGRFDGRSGGSSCRRRVGRFAGGTSRGRVLPGEDGGRPWEDAGGAVTQYRQRMNELALAWPRRVASPPSVDVALAALVAGLSLMDVWAPLSFVTR